MADDFLAYQNPSSTDERLDTESLTVNGQNVHRERVQVSGATDVGIASVLNAAPSTEYGLVTRNIPSGTQTVAGTVTANLAAGTNNIGDVDVLSLPAIPAGTNNIGDVDVLSVPAPLSTTGGGTEATALRVTIATDSTGVLSVDDNGASLTVDGTVTANAGTNLNTSALALESGGNLDTIAASLSVLDDWDETNRAAVNPIAGQVGVQGASGTVTALTQRVVLATDVALPTGTNSIGQVTANAGTNLNTSLLALEAGGNLAAIAASASVMDDWDETNRAAVNTISGQVGVAANTGTIDALTQRVVFGSTSSSMSDGTSNPSVQALGAYLSTYDGSGWNRVQPTKPVPVYQIQPALWSYHENSSSALTDQSVKAAPGAGLSIYITDIVFSTGAATACNIFFEEGSTTILGPYYLEATAGRGMAIQFATPKKVTANTALTVTTSAAIAHGLDVHGFVAPA